MNSISYILALGIENYHDGTLAKVTFAEKDAREFIESFFSLGYDKNDCILLINDRATKTAILNNLSKIVEKTTEYDRIIFYFAGHGFSVNGINVLAPVDAAIDSLDNTCISINEILSQIQKSNSKRKILFFDSCHSGFQLLENVRDGNGSFNYDNLEYEFRDVEYCTGFASCMANQKSYSHSSIKNGIWSHFLIKALRGIAEESLYENGFLMSDKLQAYLRIETQQYVKIHLRKDQTPLEFGNKMDKFVVANLNPLFNAINASKNNASLNLSSISIYTSEDNGKIKNLEGFKKNYHALPRKVGEYEDRFIKSISNDIIDNEMKLIGLRIQTLLNYKRKEIIIKQEDGLGFIQTPDFYYSILVSQSKKFPDQYEVRRSLDQVKNSSIIYNSKFNEVFDNYFTSLSFEFNKKMNVEKLIDMLEEKNKKVKYDISNLKKCSIELEGLDTELIITENSLDIFFTYPSTPLKLVEFYKNATLHLQLNKINLIEY